jgi:hypothetical protein
VNLSRPQNPLSESTLCAGQIEAFIEKLIAESPYFDQAIVLIDSRTDPLWFRDLCSIGRVAAFTVGRIRDSSRH